MISVKIMRNRSDHHDVVAVLFLEISENSFPKFCRLHSHAVQYYGCPAFGNISLDDRANLKLGGLFQLSTTHREIIANVRQSTLQQSQHK